MHQLLTLTLYKSPAGLGFTPLKYSLSEVRQNALSAGGDWVEIDLQFQWVPQEFFGLPVQLVQPGGAAAMAGVKEQDVIIGVNNEPVAHWPGEQVIGFIRSFPDGELMLEVIRSDDANDLYGPPYDNMTGTGNAFKFETQNDDAFYNAFGNNTGDSYNMGGYSNVYDQPDYNQAPPPNYGQPSPPRNYGMPPQVPPPVHHGVQPSLQQQFPQRSPLGSPGRSYSGVPRQPGDPVHVRVVRKGTGTLGLTPFKFSLNDAQKGRDAFDFQPLLSQCRFAMRHGHLGLPVQTVTPHSPADEAGVQPWDVITSVQDQNVCGWSGDRILKLFKSLPPTEDVDLMVVRDPDVGTIDPKVHPPRAAPVPQPHHHHPGQPGAFQNAQQVNAFAHNDMGAPPPPHGASGELTITIRRQMGGLGFVPFKYSLSDAEQGADSTDFKQMLRNCSFAPLGGLPVQQITPGGAAQQAGLRAWDVITTVNSINITGYSGRQAVTVIKGIHADHPVVLQVMRSATPPNEPVVRPGGGGGGGCCSCFKPPAPQPLAPIPRLPPDQQQQQHYQQSAPQQQPQQYAPPQQQQHYGAPPGGALNDMSRYPGGQQWGHEESAFL